MVGLKIFDRDVFHLESGKDKILSLDVLPYELVEVGCLVRSGC